MKLFIQVLNDKKNTGQPVVMREIELPQHWLGVVIELDGHSFRITEGDAPATLRLETSTGRLAIYPRVSNSMEVESRDMFDGK